MTQPWYMRAGAALWLSAALVLPAQAQAPANKEAVLLEIASELRCLVCQNESIAASRADLAVDLRQQISEQLDQGRTPAQIRSFMVERYGDFILFRPPLKPATVALWWGPAGLLLIGLLVYGMSLRKRRRDGAGAPLSEQDRREADALLANSREEK